MRKAMRIQTCEFKREEHSPKEVGLMINEDRLIIDMDGNTVPAPIWDWRLRNELAATVYDDD